MSQNNTVVSVNELKLGVKSDVGDSEAFKFFIDYGSFDINVGDFILVKGRNGCGKSTFLRLFHLQGQNYFKVVDGGIFYRAQGFADKSIHEYSTQELTHLNCAVAFIGQDERFLSSDSAYSYIYNACRIALDYDKELSPSERKQRLCEVDVAIREYYDKYLADSFLCKNYKVFKNKSVRAWSGGQQKMINVLAGIIKARVCGSRLVVMDEPLNNLDGKNKNILNKLVADLRQNELAVVAITHCQIFDGVNKVLYIEEKDGMRRATMSTVVEPAHIECLESFN